MFVTIVTNLSIETSFYGLKLHFEKKRPPNGELVNQIFAQFLFLLPWITTYWRTKIFDVFTVFSRLKSVEKC